MRTKGRNSGREKNDGVSEQREREKERGREAKKKGVVQEGRSNQVELREGGRGGREKGEGEERRGGAIRKIFSPIIQTSIFKFKN